MIFRRRSIFKTGFFILFVFFGVFLIFYGEAKADSDFQNGNPCWVWVSSPVGTENKACFNTAVSYPEYAASVDGSFTLSGSIGYGGAGVRSCILDPTGAGDRCFLFFGGNFLSYSLNFSLSCGGTGCETATLEVYADGTYQVSANQILNISCKDPNANNYLGSGSCTYSVPTATINANPTSVSYGDSSVISWSSANASSCAVSPTGWTGTSGSQSTGALSSTTTYTATCSGSGGSSAPASVTVNVGPPPPSPPTADITCNGSQGPCSVNSGQQFSIEWSSTNATSCNIDGTPVGTSGSTGDSLTQSRTYTFTCSNSGGSVSDQVIVNVTQPPSMVNLDFLVKNTCSNPISGATITIDQDFGNGTVKITDGSGFQNFGVKKNTVIGWSVSASGYSSSSGSVNSGNADQTVNVTLSGPCGGTPGPTPGPTTSAPPPPGGGITCMQQDSAVRNCSNYVEWAPVSKSSAEACRSYCNLNNADACEWQAASGSCYAELGNGCNIVQGFSGWWAGVEGLSCQTPTPTPTPRVTDVIINQPNYCVSGPAVTVNWTYSDPSGSPQSAYQIQIDEQSSFQNPEWDSGKILCIDCRSGSTPQGVLQFNTTYRARVKVWNQADVSSSWVTSWSWQTPPYAYPQVDFTFAPATQGMQQLIPNFPIQFTDQTVFGGNPLGRRWSWLFGDGGSSTSQNPQHTYTQANVYNATLTATDSHNQSCSITKPLNIQAPNPIWKEVNPGG